MPLLVAFSLGWLLRPNLQFPSCSWLSAEEAWEEASSFSGEDKWSSLSSDFPPPPPPKKRNRTEEIEAMGHWWTRTVNRLESLCRGGNSALEQECRTKNKALANELIQRGPVTRDAFGYNFRDFVLPIGGQLLKIEDISSACEKLLQGLQLHSAVTFMGVSMQQDPADAFAIGEIIWRTRPDLVIELGTSGGGSAFYYSHIMQRYNPNARFLTMDPAAGTLDGVPLKQWNQWQVDEHCPHCNHSSTTPEWRSMVRFVRAFPDSEEAVAIAAKAAQQADTVLVIEDSNHLVDTVKKNLAAYHGFVTPGSYFIVQDTRLGGPWRALQDFLRSENGSCFDIDKRWEYFIFSQHFDGFLKKRENCFSVDILVDK